MSIVLASIILAVIPGFTQIPLSDAQSRAVANNVDVQIATATVRSREATLELARTGGIPHLTGDYALAPQAGPFDQTTVAQHFITIGAGITINDILAASQQTRSATNDLLAAQRDADAATLTARVNGTKLYFAALQAIAIESLRADAVAGAQRDRSAADLRARSGDAPRLDVVRADVTLAQARADLARAQADRADAIDALASAIDVDPASLSHLGGDLDIQRASSLDERRAVTRALAARPEIASLLATISARQADVAVARQSGLPTTTATGGYQQGVDSGVPVKGPAVGVHLDFPIASPQGARVAQAQAQVDQVRAQLVDARRTVALAVASAVRDARAADDAEHAAVQARDEARRALDAVELGYREGASSSLDVSDARRTSIDASVNALVAEYQRAQAYALVEVLIP